MSKNAQEPLLSQRSYDEDATLVESGSDIDRDSDDNEIYDNILSATATDRQILEDADEEERLLRKPGRFDGVVSIFKSQGNQARQRKRIETRAKRSRQAAEGAGNAEMIYEMEGGYKDNSSRSSTESLALKEEKWNQEPKSGTPFLRLILISFAMALLFSLLAYGSYSASQHTKLPQLFSNGTHLFGPTTILISLDGFRADFLHRGLTPAMRAFIESGVSPEYMLPSFPSLTFPNHFTLVTGLYPESHGIVSNQFWDPDLQDEFYYTNISNSMQPKWWNAEPLWVTAQKAGLKTAIHMWPGSEAHIDNTDPTYVDKFNGTEILEVKVNRVLQWLDMSEDQRPQLIGAYVPNVDSDGHEYGPNSTEIRATIAEVDSMLTSLIQGLFERNLTEIVNVVIVSDHGMATTSNDRLIQLDDFIDMSLVDHIDGWPLRGLRLKDADRDLQSIHEQLLAASTSSNFDVYTRETMPERYHFSNNDRIAPIWVVPHTGWAVVEKADFDVKEAIANGQRYHPFGLHGYDHEHPLMRAIFIARGPAFPHAPNSRAVPFQNIEVYNIVCDSLGIEPQPNNGTLRLPLKVDGLHSDFDDPLDIPADPVTSGPVTHQSSVASGTSLASGTSVTGSATTADPTGDTGDIGDEESSATNENDDKSGARKSSWWDFIHNKLEKAKEWAKELIDSIRNNKSSEDRQPV